MKMKDLLDGSPPYLLAVAAAACLGLAIFFAWQDKLKAATLLSALFVICTVLAYFPRLDSIKAFTLVDVKLKRGLDQAEEILTKIRKASVASARVAYMGTAWGGRWGGMSERDKQELLDSVNEQLQAVGIKDEEREEIVRPHVEFIGYDLYNIFYNSVRGVLQHYRTNTIEADRLQLISEWEGKWRPSGLESLRPYLRNGLKLTAYMKEHLSQSFLDPSDYEKLGKLAEKIGTIFDGCWRRSGYTEDSLNFFDVYRKKVFSGQPQDYYNFISQEQW
jgi:hypothetical protein